MTKFDAQRGPKRSAAKQNSRSPMKRDFAEENVFHAEMWTIGPGLGLFDGHIGVDGSIVGE